MIALSEDEALMSRLFQFRFSSAGALDDHSFGNLFLTAMASVTGDFAKAVRLASEVLAIKGIIYPSTNSNAHLRAELEDGSWVEGETAISSSHVRVRRVHLDPPDALPLKEALAALRSADLITIGPGSLFTSLIPNLLVKQVIEAIRVSYATKVYIQNIMTQPGETEGYSAADHVQALAEHCDGVLFKNVLLNNRLPSAHLIKRYEAERASVVQIDHSKLRAMGLNIVERDLLAEGGKIRHDPDQLAAAVLGMQPQKAERRA
jgi:uncharacterized cofD-like protein